MSHPLQPPPLSRPTTPTPNPSLPPLTTTPSRVSTAPVKSKHHHIPHHPHRIHHHYHNHHHRDKSVPQSAVQPPSVHPFGDAVTKTTSRGEYEREAVLAQEKVREMKAKEDERQAGIWKVVERKREGRRRVDEHLRQTLLSLSTLSTVTTRRLDYTYYSLLEHVSILSTLTSHLSDLASTSASLHTTFHASATTLNTTYTTQITTWAPSFKAQAARIAALEQRLKKSQEQAGALGLRLDGVRGRVKGWERREREWRDRVRMTLRMLWGSVSCFVGVFVVLLVLRCWPRAAPGLEVVVGNNRTLDAGLGVEAGEVAFLSEGEGDVFGVLGEGRIDGEGEVIGTFTTREEEEKKDGEKGSQKPHTTLSLEDDPRLRIFDEL